MNLSTAFIRAFFVLLSVLLVTCYTTAVWGMSFAHIVIGLIAGSLFGAFLAATDLFFRLFSLRMFNVALLGLFCGYMMGEAVFATLASAVDLSPATFSKETMGMLRLGIFLFTTYLGLSLAFRSSDEIYLSIPFFKFKPASHKKKDILLDQSSLLDHRIVDLASSGILDNSLLVARFTVKELNAMLEAVDESAKSKARRCLDALKKLENIPSLELRYAENEFPELKDPQSKLHRLARFLDADILTSEITRIQQAQADNVKFININTLANALKPVTSSGEMIQIKIQRYGKEPRQGVGYLDDGTMVVVNGGAEYIGDVIKAQVLSVKHTTSGRMIFCNALEEGSMECSSEENSAEDLENAHKNYFAL